MKKKIISVLLASVMLLGSVGFMSACGGEKGAEENTLTVRFYNGGYGDKWLEDALESFCATKEGVTYKMIADNNITANAVNYLKTNVPDIIMSNGNWKDFVGEGYLEPLDDVYETEVETSSGKQKIKDYVDQDTLRKYTRQKQYGRGQEHIWAMPWTTQVLSLAYNENILLSTVHHSDNPFTVDGLSVGKTWTHEPYTINELMAYLTDVRLADNGIIPWGYAVDNLNWYSSLFCVLWAQLQGLSEENLYEGEGCYYDFFNMPNAEICKQSGYREALDIIRKILVNDEGKLYNSDNDGSVTKEQLQTNFAKGKVAVTLVGEFFEKEYKSFMSDDNVIKLMYIPVAEGAEKNSDGTAKKYTYVLTENVMYVPAKATNIELAKEFLAYICNEQQLREFTKETGALRPYNYNPYELDSDYEWTTFQKSMFNLYYNCDEHVIEYPVTAKTISPIYIYEGVEWFCGVSMDTIFGEFRKTPVDKAADRIVDKVYTALKNGFEEWEQLYGISE